MGVSQQREGDCNAEMSMNPVTGCTLDAITTQLLSKRLRVAVTGRGD